METVVTPDESQLLLEFLAALVSASAEESSGIVERFSFKAAELYTRFAKRDVAKRLEAGFLALVHIVYCSRNFAERITQGLREWYEIFYEELEEGAIAVRPATTHTFHWETVCRFLTSGLFEKAKAILLQHPALSIEEDDANTQQYLQAQCLAILIDLIDTRPTVFRFSVSEQQTCFEAVECSELSEAYFAWFHEKWMAFQETIQKNRLALGFEFSGNIQDVANILSGNEACLKEYAEDKLAFFVARVFHTPRYVSTHLQLRLIWEHIAGKMCPSFSGWNLSLRALMMDVLSFDQEKLLQDISGQKVPFSLFTRLSLAVIFDDFFQEEGSFGREALASLDNEPFFPFFAERLCMKLKTVREVLQVLLFCPGIRPADAVKVLTHLDVEKKDLRDSIMRFPQTEEYKTQYLDKITAAGWLKALHQLIGRAHHYEGHVGFAASYFVKGEVPDEENIALKSAQDIIAQILTNDKENFMRALKLETLNTEELLSAGIERQQIWTEIKSVLKEIPPVLHQNAELLSKLRHFTVTEEETASTTLYGLIARITTLLTQFPEDTNRVLEPDERRALQDSFQAALCHPHLSDNLKFLLALKVIHLAYLFGSHVAGYGIFGKSFMKDVLQILKTKSLTNIDPTESLQRILHSIHKTLMC